MGRAPRDQAASGKQTKVWNVREARERFDDLLTAAAQNGPQTVRDNRRVFKVTLERAGSSPVGKGLLTKGGPLETTDVLED
ncbi:hypothetical protein [Mesorhizobium sp. B1-1-6]|uniref:hypothetical protein n=1 Tax=Mesorhizobium sp. B1-1-6 TaxID=2589978 RepID=UPI0011260973|nr:hypothetical protein [Mesorhizobium sp. B1-1-6]TPN35241.1 hypothetical protein FJ979_20410 [Mesorhizobium sp. B1-1-6]